MSNRLSLISCCGRLFSTLCRLSRLALLHIRLLLWLLLAVLGLGLAFTGAGACLSRKGARRVPKA